MRAAAPIAFVACLVLALTWFSYRAVNPEAELFDHALADLDHFAMVGNALHRDVFAARVGMLRNYDPLVREVEALRASLQRLRETAAIDAETTAVIDRLAASIDRQEELIELFKSENALLQNSLSFFGRFAAGSAPPNLDPAISAAAAAIMRLTLDSSAGAAHDVQERLDALEQQARQAGQEQSVEGLLAHGRLLYRLLPSVDGTLKAMRALPQKQDRDALRALILEDQLASRMSARSYRALLYGTSLLLVSSLVFFGVRLKSRARALHRRAAIEHMIAGISMRFINAPLQTIDAEIDRALAEMAGFCGADRAYFVTSGPVQRVHLWHGEGMAPPPGWPARALDLAVRLGGADGVIHVPCVRRMPVGEARSICLGLGLGGWACATNADADGVRVVLGFDAVGRPCRIARRSELGLMRMALDTIVQAVGRHTMEKERARLEARLQQARRMERIGMFTSGIAHNFNNILGGILGHSEVMEERVGPDAKLLRNLGAIRRGAERARDLIDHILVFGRSRAVCRKPLSVGALIAETASLLEVARPSAVELVIRQPPTATLVSGEHAQLQQVLLNLCRNAANAMPDGGRIEVATAFDEMSETRTLSHGEIGPGQYVCIAVSDTGQGMDETTLGRIFEPFFTTRSSGNGLGLATVREIVRDHHGAIDVHSRAGEGSRFEVWLPRTAAAEQLTETNAISLPTGTGETIMLVAQDGERLLRDEEMLAALGYEPVGFSRSDAAIAACRASPGRFDMIIVGDFGSAARSLDLAASLHAVAPRLSIVLAIRAAIEIGADRLVSAGISDVVRWPMVTEEIAFALTYSATVRRTDLPSRPQLAPVMTAQQYKSEVPLRL
ncbi:MAG TPA: two-component system VirA-like sensor kinase [Bradyrhizobium sp.]|nr:two-component system VirA-like sensor kinase [Bradyrhizobium sp.]